MHVTHFDLAWIPFFVLLGAAFAYILGSESSRFRSVWWISGAAATAASFCSFLAVLAAFFALPAEGVLEQTVFPWIRVGILNADFVLRLDRLSAVMCLVVTGIGTLIHLYSVAYMAEDAGRHRFFTYLNLFMFSMLLLVLGGNLLVLFVGWEGVGLCSYLLIGFWFKNMDYAKAGQKAFVVNRIGDAGFLIAIFLCLWRFGSVDFLELQRLIPAYSGATMVFTLVGLSLFVGATGKSAQIPLYVWLPDAMAGPTPVSALIHAATMVTAGVYMMARMHFLFALTPFTLAVVAVIAVLTALVAATIAVTQNDIKKVLAYSTVSQLGFMFMAAAMGAYWVAVFHLVTHAFFKACLFLGAGSVIHGCHHEQDMRHMGGLWSKMPITGTTYLISTLAIAGIFPFAGYQSKHAILAAMTTNSNPVMAGFANLLPMIASLTALLTAFYMTRSFAMTFLGEYRGHAHPHESPWQMTLPLVVLAALALVGGWYLEGHLPEFLSPAFGAHLHAHHTGLVEGLIGSWIGLVGVAAGLLLYAGAIPALRELPGKAFAALRPLATLLQNKYYVDELYQAVIVAPLAALAKLLWRRVDQNIVDAAVNGTGQFIEVNGEVLRYLQTGDTRHYALFTFAGALVMIVLYFVLL